MTRTVITMKTPTLATKAARELTRAGIRAGATRIHSSMTKNGCTAGVEVWEEDRDRALVCLAKAAIPYGEVLYL